MVQSKSKYPVIIFILSQIITLLILRNAFVYAKIAANPILFLLLQILLSIFLTQIIFKLPSWFKYLDFILPISVFIFFNFININSWIYLFLFIIIMLLFSHVLKERVPLYLTNQKTEEALKKIIEETKAQKFIDLGSGSGKVVRAIGSSKCQSFGTETAPLLFFYSYLMSLITKKGRIFFKNIWQKNLSEYDIVYAFLSPAVMDKLYDKIKKEMRPGTIFITNSFIVEKNPTDEVWELDDSRKTKLYIYRNF